MDTLAHGLWSNIIVYKKYPQSSRMRFIAVLFGVLPDLIPFTPLFIYLIFSRGFGGPESWQMQHWTMAWAYEAYNFTHSLVVFAATTAIVWAVRREFYFPMIAWGFHILLDMPTHPDFYQTPFLFPISSYKLSWGLSWGHWAIMIPQYAFFAVWYSWWVLKGRKKNRSEPPN